GSAALGAQPVGADPGPLAARLARLAALAVRRSEAKASLTPNERRRRRGAADNDRGAVLRRCATTDKTWLQLPALGLAVQRPRT
ncbi:MAG: hypothetical protein ABI808_11050, partial [Pseudonocardiales bacterium]